MLRKLLARNRPWVRTKIPEEIEYFFYYSSKATKSSETKTRMMYRTVLGTASTSLAIFAMPIGKSALLKRRSIATARETAGTSFKTGR
jgi:hypothetical protein